MFISRRITSAAICFFSSMTFLMSQMTRAQALDLVAEDLFDSTFLIVSPNGTVASHGISSFVFGQTATLLNSNYAFIPNLTLTTNLQRVASNNYDLNFLLTTGTNAGFIPPGTTLGGQLVNQWSFDLGNIFFNNTNGINFLAPVTYNSAEGSWFDDGVLVFSTSYLPQLNFDSTTTQLLGQFEIALSSGDLGAFGNGIDTFTLTVNVSTQSLQSVPEPSTSICLIFFGSLAGVLTIFKPSRLLGYYCQYRKPHRT